MEQAAAGRRKAVRAERWPAQTLAPGGRVDEVRDGTTVVRATQAGWRVCSTRTMAQAANSSTSEKWGADFADVPQSFMKSRSKMPMMMQPQDQNAKPSSHCPHSQTVDRYAVYVNPLECSLSSCTPRWRECVLSLVRVLNM